VRDTGCGISAAAQAQVFEAFYQTDDNAGTRRGGVGLGLFLVRRLVQAMRGTIMLESESGRGCTFYVWVPSQAAPMAH